VIHDVFVLIIQAIHHRAQQIMPPSRKIQRGLEKIERLGSAAKRQLTSSHLGGGDDEDSHTDEGHRPKRSNPPRTHHRITRRPFDPQSLTEDERPAQEERPGHLRTLFLKGRIPHKQDHLMVENNGDPQDELRALQLTIAREASFRQRQAQVMEETQAESEAQARVKEVEAGIYAQRNRCVVFCSGRCGADDQGLDGCEAAIGEY
jgi:hypothetical protein